MYDESHKPVFKMDPPPSSSNLQLAVDLLNQDRHRRGATNRCKGEGSGSGSIHSLRETIQGGISSNDVKIESAWNDRRLTIISP